MNIDWNKVLNEYLPIAVIAIIAWQVLEGYFYLFFHDFYLGFRNILWNPWIGVPFSVVLAALVTTIIDRPKEEELIIFIIIVAGMLLYIFGAVGWHPELTLPN